jgi:uncharacterized protein YukE
MGTTSVDPAALRAAAQRMDAAADIVDSILAANLCGLRFDAAVAGRDYAAVGGAVRGVLDRLVADMTRWAVAARETSAALRTGADRFSDAESRAVANLR